MSDHAVLILATDTLAAALLGAAVDLAGLAPHFPRSGEGMRAALRRVRPRLALVDCDHTEGCTEAFLGPALMTGTRVLLFRSPRTASDVSRLAEELELPVLELPTDQAPLDRELRTLANDGDRR